LGPPPPRKVRFLLISAAAFPALNNEEQAGEIGETVKSIAGWRQARLD
jgi:hypothetical protein